MRRGVRIWLLGILAALIVGGANGCTSAFAANMIAPETFNIDGGVTKLIQLVLANVVVGGGLGVAAFLMRSPLPPSLAKGLALPPAKD